MKKRYFHARRDRVWLFAAESGGVPRYEIKNVLAVVAIYSERLGLRQKHLSPASHPRSYFHSLLISRGEMSRFPKISVNWFNVPLIHEFIPLDSFPRFTNLGCLYQTLRDVGRKFLISHFTNFRLVLPSPLGAISTVNSLPWTFAHVNCRCRVFHASPLHSTRWKPRRERQPSTPFCRAGRV